MHFKGLSFQWPRFGVQLDKSRPIETGLIGQVVTGFELGNVDKFLIERHEVSATLQPESLYRDECNNR